MEETTAQRLILGKCTVTTSCWIWKAARNAYGYGVVAIPGTSRTALAHRFAYEAWKTPVPAGLDLDHLCRNRACVNPQHLEPVTRRVNLLRGETLTARNAAKTECPQGHPYAGANLIVRYRKGQPGRRCRTCDLAGKALHRQRLKAGVK